MLNYRKTGKILTLMICTIILATSGTARAQDIFGGLFGGTVSSSSGNSDLGTTIGRTVTGGSSSSFFGTTGGSSLGGLTGSLTGNGSLGGSIGRVISTNGSSSSIGGLTGSIIGSATGNNSLGGSIGRVISTNGSSSSLGGLTGSIIGSATGNNSLGGSIGRVISTNGSSSSIGGLTGSIIGSATGNSSLGNSIGRVISTNGSNSSIGSLVGYMIGSATGNSGLGGSIGSIISGNGSIGNFMRSLLGGSGSLGSGETIGIVIMNTVSSAYLFPNLLAAIAYIIGITLGTMGILKIYEHVQNPNQTHISEGLKRLLAGGGFLALPMVIEAAARTLDGGNTEGIHLNSFSGGATGDGLDAVMQALMLDIYMPMEWALKSFCYVAGIVLVMIGISRLLKTSQEGPRGPGGTGTLMTFLVAGALLSVDAMMAAWSTSSFGTNTIANKSALAYTGGLNSLEEAHILGVISTILIFMMILGWVSFIRGWFILRDVAEGSHNASLMAGLTHLFGGALAVNLGPLMNAVQATLGLTGYGVNFT